MHNHRIHHQPQTTHICTHTHTHICTRSRRVQMCARARAHLVNERTRVHAHDARRSTHNARLNAEKKMLRLHAQKEQVHFGQLRRIRRAYISHYEAAQSQSRRACRRRCRGRRQTTAIYCRVHSHVCFVRVVCVCACNEYTYECVYLLREQTSKYAFIYRMYTV